MKEYSAIQLSSENIIDFVVHIFNISGFLMNRIGRKLSLILWALVSIVGFSLTASENIVVICIGRVICGVSVGASVMVGKQNMNVFIDKRCINPNNNWCDK